MQLCVRSGHFMKRCLLEDTKCPVYVANIIFFMKNQMPADNPFAGIITNILYLSPHCKKDMQKKIRKIRIYTTSTSSHRYISAEIEHDEKGNEVLVKTYTSDGELQSEHEYTYDEENKLVQQRDWSGEDGFYLVKKMTYNPEGKLQEEAVYYEGDDEPVSTVKHTYHGAMHTEETFDEENSLIQQIRWEHDENDNILLFEFHDLLNQTGESYTSTYFGKDILRERIYMDMHKRPVRSRTGEHSVNEEGMDVYTYTNSMRGVSVFHSEKTIREGLTISERIAPDGAVTGKLLEVSYLYDSQKSVVSEEALNNAGDQVYRHEYSYDEHHNLVRKKSEIQVNWLQFFPERPVESYHLEEREIEYWD